MLLPWSTTGKVELMGSVELTGNGAFVVGSGKEVLLVGVGRGIVNRV